MQRLDRGPDTGTQLIAFGLLASLGALALSSWRKYEQSMRLKHHKDVDQSYLQGRHSKPQNKLDDLMMFYTLQEKRQSEERAKLAFEEGVRQGIELGRQQTRNAIDAPHLN